MWAQRSKHSKPNGVEFVESSQLHPEDRGALTRGMLALSRLIGSSKPNLLLEGLPLSDGFGIDTITMAAHWRCQAVCHEASRFLASDVDGA
jgi:hypothetical protein